MSADRVVSATIKGLRSIREVTLELDGLVTLIGENGSGKSTIIEALEILRRMAWPMFLDELHSIHGGPFALWRHGTKLVELGARLRIDDGSYDYAMVLNQEGGAARILGEVLRQIQPSGDRVVFQRAGSTVSYGEGGEPRRLVLGVVDQPAIAVLRSIDEIPIIGRVARALESIEVHVPFDTTPSWIGLAHQLGATTMRRSVRAMPAKGRLERRGANLANAYAELRNQANWEETLDYLRLGLGPDIERVNIEVDAGGGALSLSVKLANVDRPVPTDGLSDGMLSYLCFVALHQLHNPARSILAFDEPETHLHPGMLARVVQLFESMSEHHPVVVATHSDALLDMLSEPASSIRICELTPENGTRVRTLDAGALSGWLADYRGAGELRAAGYLHTVVAGGADRR